MLPSPNLASKAPDGETYTLTHAPAYIHLWGCAGAMLALLGHQYQTILKSNWVWLGLNHSGTCSNSVMLCPLLNLSAAKFLTGFLYWLSATREKNRYKQKQQLGFLELCSANNLPAIYRLFKIPVGYTSPTKINWQTQAFKRNECTICFSQMIL